MKIIHIGILCFLSAVCVEASVVVEVSGYVGGDVSILCSSKWTTDSGSNNYNMYFCKGVCSNKNIVIQTDWKKSSVVQRGRYSMGVDRREGVFTVTIKRLEKTDAGRYNCGLERTFKVFHQEVDLKVLDSSTVSPGSFPSNTTLHTMTSKMPLEDQPSSAASSPAAVIPPPIEEKTDQPATKNLTDTTVVIIVSVSLALLVCAIIPIIFYGRWRSNIVRPGGPDADKASKVEADYNEENEEQDVPSTSDAVGLEPVAPHVGPGPNVPDASQYASAYQALDPKSLE